MTKYLLLREKIVSKESGDKVCGNPVGSLIWLCRPLDTGLEISYTYEECHWAALAHSSKPNPKSYWGPRVHERQYEEK